MAEQDWDNVTVLRKQVVVPRVTRKESAVNAARRAGAVVDTERKTAGGTNRHSSSDHQRIAKLDREDDVTPLPKISLTVGQAIQQARKNIGLKQNELAQRINEKASVINDYEASRAVPNQQILSKLERVLKVKLRGKDIGKPLH